MSQERRSAGRRRRIALICHDSAKGRGIMRGVLSHARLREDWTLLHRVDRSPAERCQLLGQIYDGAVVAAHWPAVRQAMADCPYPVVAVEAEPELGESLAFPLITEDEAAKAHLAVAHLAALGPRHLAYIDRCDELPLRRRHVLAAMRRIDPTAEHCSRDEMELLPWLQGRPGRLAVVCNCLQAASDLVLAAEELGVGIPEELAILACGADELEAAFIAPGLSYIDADDEAIGRRAAACLQAAFDGHPVRPRIERLPPRSVVCDTSSDPMAGLSGPLVRARRHINARLGAGHLQARDIAAAVGMPLRSLQRLCRAELGHGLAEEVRTQRLSLARRLLRQSEDSITTIALATGFHDSAHLARCFKQLEGCSPSRWRVRHGRLSAPS